ncbi:MAG: Crp/Fnr family transcriptional regulator [Bacteroidaceae bacterium]|nr:Crp/Fnr family transcriptional regulator [Bacteroidaceae bacterium]
MQDLAKRYALFTRLPLLQGISSTELLGWEESLRLDPDELPASSLPIIRQGDTCSSLLFLTKGELLREHVSSDGTYATRSHLKTPAVIEADRLFGLTPVYEYTYRALTDVALLNIPKTLLDSHLMKSEVFRLNVLNMLSATAQKRAAALLPFRQDNAEARLRHFIRILFLGCEGEVELIIQMKELARYIGETRLTTSRLLNRWEEEGLIRLGRGHFVIHDLQTFLGGGKDTDPETQPHITTTNNTNHEQFKEHTA